MQSYSVLIADDYQPLRDLLGEVFSGEGFQVFTANNAEEALRHLDQAMPHMIVLDNKMSGRSGLSLLPEIRQRPGGSQAAIIMVTGDHLIEHSTEASLADLILLKPINIAELLTFTERLVSNRAPTRASRPAPLEIRAS